ncbi:tRNA-i(6)A37 thiotransferase enzyme MiaB [Aneurinibacillus soli]|uniref:tRNA-2-methylthio-N(6)-dimethylallyladenosine synthase n=1 Tax=Aneurinibacillus soli TaxID=1500254 RepID=A0A0U4WJW2_9BACL|nr:tRNA (N6-isopentenyl adenosine(37)-C2)-methylthiotransferase MiaB [Aneurinibacillus soli]PYE63134.1 tRNA-i(6)A37 thiotransferase enzyme MiaB [Aneurinibacillus soli]BAU28808.1 (Dimethylallyl)adenosine tRNA methylthiotransferase MiaB [Aneurinibacillus soli]
MTHETKNNSASSVDLKSAPKKEKDYSKYFSGTAPSLKDAKKRTKNGIEYNEFEGIPEELQELGKGRTYLIRTYGCQANEHDTETIIGLFQAMNFTETEEEAEADVILFNTCAVREGAEDKVFGEIGRLKALKKEKPELILGVCGCMSQEEAVVNRILKSYPHVDLIFGTHNIHRLPVLLRDAFFNKEMVIEVWSKEGDVVENMPKVRKEGLRAWVNIMYGCDKFCTYCIVPYTRGKERSRRPEDVLAEVRDLARQGYKEIFLLGQNVNAYGKDFTDIEYGFGDLMDDVRKIDVPRVRFTTSHPRDFDDHLIEVLAKKGNLMEYIHLPMQSGSTEVLKRMARKYTREQYMELVRKIKAAIPDAVLTTDIIVGFPGETEEQFQETMSLVEEVGFHSAYTFIYSPRSGTPAAGMEDNVPEAEKKDRLQRLISLVNRLGREQNENLRGQVVEVLVEGESKNNPDVLMGRTRTNKIVHFTAPKEMIGQLIHVTITEPQTWILYGEVTAKAEV